MVPKGGAPREPGRGPKKKNKIKRRWGKTYTVGIGSCRIYVKTTSNSLDLTSVRIESIEDLLRAVVRSNTGGIRSAQDQLEQR